MGLVLLHPGIVQCDEITRIVGQHNAIVCNCGSKNVSIANSSQVGFAHRYNVMACISQLSNEQFCLGALIDEQSDGQFLFLFL